MKRALLGLFFLCLGARPRACPRAGRNVRKADRRAVAIAVVGPHAEEPVVLGKIDRVLGDIADFDDVVPHRAGGVAVDDLVTSDVGLGTLVPPDDGALGKARHHQPGRRRPRRRVRQGVQDRRVEPSDIRQIPGVHILHNVAVAPAVNDPHVGVLTIVALVDLGEPHRGKALLVERGVVPAAEKAVRAVDQPRLDRQVVALGDVVDEPSQLTGGRVVGGAEPVNPAQLLGRRLALDRLTEDAYTAPVDLSPGAGGVPDNVIAERGPDVKAALGGRPGEPPGPQQALLLAGGHEKDQRRLAPTACKDTGKLESRSGAGGVIIGPRRFS